MKNIKNTIAAATMMAVLAFGTTFAHAGIIIAGRTAEAAPTQKADPCSTPSDGKDMFGIIIAGFAGIIIAGRTGIIIAGFSDESVVNCGIIIAGKS